MMKDKRPRRELALAVELPVAPERVWQALVNAEELPAWLCASADVAPGEGGHYAWTLHDGRRFGGPIGVWSPGQRLRIGPLARPETAGGPERHVDWLLTGDARRSRLALQWNPPPDGAEGRSTESGLSDWPVAVACLQHYLTWHPGERRAVAGGRLAAAAADALWAAGETAFESLPDGLRTRRVDEHGLLVVTGAEGGGVRWLLSAWGRDDDAARAALEAARAEVPGRRL